MATLEHPVSSPTNHFCSSRLLNRTYDERATHYRKLNFLPNF